MKTVDSVPSLRLMQLTTDNHFSHYRELGYVLYGIYIEGILSVAFHVHCVMENLEREAFYPLITPLKVRISFVNL